MTHEAPQVLALPYDDGEPNLPLADELVVLTLAVAKVVSAGAALVWLMLTQRSRFGANLAYVTLADLVQRQRWILGC